MRKTSQNFFASGNQSHLNNFTVNQLHKKEFDNHSSAKRLNIVMSNDEKSLKQPAKDATYEDVIG